MTSLQRGIVTLIRSAITGERYDLPPDFEIEQVYAEAVRHQIQPMVYIGAIKCGVAKDLPTMRRLFQAYCNFLRHSDGQIKTVECICNAFDEGGIDYLPLKGSNLKKLYPEAELRLMGDADILIKVEQYDQIRNILAGIGMEEQSECDHVIEWDTKTLHLELHKRLVPSYDKDYYKYFGDGWERARLKERHEFELATEDEFVFIFTHFAKHYRDGGIGCRHVTDLWVYRRAYPEMDETYIVGELSKLRLDAFYRHMMRMLEVWFYDGDEDEKSRFITNYIFAGGVWGKFETRIVAGVAKDVQTAGSFAGGYMARVREMLFPELLVMKQKYPVLNKVPVLLPVCWGVRWVSAALFRRENIAAQRTKIKTASRDKIENFQQALNYVGLDFHFKE